MDARKFPIIDGDGHIIENFDEVYQFSRRTFIAPGIHNVGRCSWLNGR